MTAVVVQLRKRVCSSQTWTNQEIAEFYRVTELLGQAGLAVGLDGGITDEGDVWQVFFREDTGDVLAHFAKIDGDYVIAIPATNDVLRGQDLREMIASMMERQPTLMARAQKAKSNVHLHPTMMLSSFIVMIYLLAVDSSEAVAADDVADAIALAAQSIADAEAADAEAGAEVDGDQASVRVESRSQQSHHHFDEDRGSSDLQSLVITVSMGQTPTLSPISASAAQPVLIKKLESPAYIDRFSSTMTAVVAAAASILGAGNHDEDQGIHDRADLQLADLQQVNADAGKNSPNQKVDVASQDRNGDSSSHASTLLTPADQGTQIAITVAPVVLTDGSVVSIKLALPGVLAIDRASGNIVTVATGPNMQQGGVALDGFSVVVSPKSQPVQKVQSQGQSQPAVAHEGGEPAVAAAPAPAATPVEPEAPVAAPVTEAPAPQLANDQEMPVTPVPQQSKITIEPIKAGSPDQMVELKFMVLPSSSVGGTESVILVPSDLEEFPTIINDLEDEEEGVGPIKPGGELEDQPEDQPDGEEGEMHILPFDEANTKVMNINIAHFAHAIQPLDLSDSPGQDLVVYSGGNIVINGFELGVDRLVIENRDINPEAFNAYWINQGVLKVDFGGGETITMTGIIVDGVAL